MTENTYNDQILRCGIEYIAHYDKSYIRCIGTSWSIDIPQNRLRDFISIFPEYNWEDGIFLDDLKGTYVRVTYNSDFNIVSLKHIVKNLTYEVLKSE